MNDNKSYNYTDNFSEIIHTTRFINAAELSGLFFSAPKWITISKPWDFFGATKRKHAVNAV